MNGLRFDGEPTAGPMLSEAALTEPCLTVDQIAAALGISTRSVQRMIASGKLRKLPL